MSPADSPRTRGLLEMTHPGDPRLANIMPYMALGIQLEVACEMSRSPARLARDEGCSLGGVGCGDLQGGWRDAVHGPDHC